jgi:LysR family transcriptional regulator, hydrogen peroxide-inducible genes activator
MPSLRQLQYFVALSEAGHFRIAAEKVGVSQPTLSAQLLALERRLGVPLVERNRAPVILTAAGARILPLAKRAVAIVQEIHDMAQSHRKGMVGVLRLGLPASIGPYLLPKLLPALHASHPELRLFVREDYPLALPDALAAGRHDLLVAPLPVKGSEMACLRLFREPLFLAVPSDHELAACIDADPGRLRDQPILTLEKGHALHEQVQLICQDCGARVLHDYEGTSLSTLHHMVAMGVGLTFLPGLYAQSAMDAHSGVKLLTLKSKPLYRTIGLVWRASSQEAGTYKQIGQHIRESVRRHFPDFQIHTD